MTQIEVPSLEPDPNQELAVTVVPPADEPKPEEQSAAEPEEPRPAPRVEKGGSSSQKIWGYSMIGLGAAGVGVGAYFGMDALSKNQDSMDLCRSEDPTQCTTEGEALRSQALTSATVSSIAIGVGVAAAVSGVVLVLTAPSAQTQVARGFLWEESSDAFVSISPFVPGSRPVSIDLCLERLRLDSRH
jgi:hypothetical protein